MAPPKILAINVLYPGIIADHLRRDERVDYSSSIEGKPTFGGKIPPTYRNASWRNTLPFDSIGNGMGVGFDVHGGETIRLYLDKKSAVNLVETMANYLDIQIQSSTSTGSPISDVSIPEEGE